jgi:hypothetical protein
MKLNQHNKAFVASAFSATLVVAAAGFAAAATGANPVSKARAEMRTNLVNDTTKITITAVNAVATTATVEDDTTTTTTATVADATSIAQEAALTNLAETTPSVEELAPAVDTNNTEVDDTEVDDTEVDDTEVDATEVDANESDNKGGSGSNSGHDSEDSGGNDSGD